MNMSQFTLPRDIYFGRGSLSNLTSLQGKKAFVVTGGGSMQRFGFLGKTEEHLKEAGTVSYTHLDVYKRQGTSGGSLCHDELPH